MSSTTTSTNNITANIEHIQRQEQEYKNLLLRLEQEKANLIKEQERLELERKEQERIELERQEKERIELEKKEKERIELEKKTALEQHLEEINREYPDLEEKQRAIVDRFTSKNTYELRDNKVKEQYEIQLLEQLKKYKIYHAEFGSHGTVSFGEHCTFSCEYIIMINIYGECHGWGLQPGSVNRHCSYRYNFNGINVNDIQEIVKKDILLSFISKRLFVGVYGTGEYLGPGAMPNFKNINLWTKEQERIKQENRAKEVLALKNDIYKNKKPFSDENLSIIQEALLQDVTYYVLCDSILATLKRFKIVGIIQDSSAHSSSYYSANYYGVPNANKEYTYNNIICNCIDIYGNIYTGTLPDKVVTHRNGGWHNVLGNCVIPSLESPKNVDWQAFQSALSKCEPRGGDVLTPDVLIPILNKKYCVGSNIYQSYLNIKEKEDKEQELADIAHRKKLAEDREEKERVAKIKRDKIKRDNTIKDLQESVKPELIRYIQSILEDNNDFIPYYKYIANIICGRAGQMIQHSLTEDEMYRYAIHVFKTDIKNYKMNLIEYANLRSKGITDPSYLEMINESKSAKDYRQ